MNVGCVPKKVMWNTAFVNEVLHDAKDYGFDDAQGSEGVGVDDWKVLFL